ncbi:hypothetical protein PQR64_24050 [Paraburkholderia phytofirmans]|jgi:hypothetical protein|uniref:hypothetical protein n=1 Tax=Paraburkholderia phytofirmans TaxID=261302 RepID=UPI0038B93413
MGETVELSSRSSEFVSIRQLVFAIAAAEKRQPAEIATSLWNLLSESASAPEWLQHHKGVTYRLEPRAQDTGWFALRALREGRECHGGWDHKIGFSRPRLRSLFESCGLSFLFEADDSAMARLPPGPERDAAMLAAHTRYTNGHVRNPLARTAADFHCSKTVITRAIKREKERLGDAPAPSPTAGSSAWHPGY